MIPRLKPFLDHREFLALFKSNPNAVSEFEQAFARAFGVKQAIAYPYGRSALWAFLKTLDIHDAEIIQPAYTCVVVAHATLLSGNRPRFVDVSLYDYNMNLDQVESAINERTRLILATHLFGYPLDVNRLDDIVRRAEARYGHKIWVIQDCAHSFGGEWQGRAVVKAGDVALFGLNISKMITSIFGGMLTTNDENLASRLRQWRDANFTHPSWVKAFQRRLYLMAIYPAFNNTLYGFVHWLQEETPLLNRLTKAYHLDEKVHFPPDYQEQMLPVEANVGLAQLGKLQEILRARRENARYYSEHLQGVSGLTLPPLVDGATYSHYVVRVKDRLSVMKALARKGIQLGQLIEYSIPSMPAYSRYIGNEDFPNSLCASRSMINLPVHTHVSATDRSQIAYYLIEAVKLK
jgi:dTDP-4-amino-4,6-dideoxygalactose transaminase